MKLTHYLSLLVCTAALLCTSCRSAHDKELEKQLVGEWKIFQNGILEVEKGNVKFISDTIIQSQGRSNFTLRSGYEFSNDRKCINKHGYFTRRNHERSLIFNTKYCIIEDSLQIWNQEDNYWDKSAISFIGNDTLLLSYTGGYYYKYIRCKYPNQFKTTFDQIVICRKAGLANEPIYMRALTKLEKYCVMAVIIYQCHICIAVQLAA